MKIRTLTTFCIVFILAFSLLEAASLFNHPGQETEGEDLALKYRAYLKEAEWIMTSDEKGVFLELDSDADRDYFIRRFWQERGDQKLRDNISTLMLLRLTQALDLTEAQAARLFPMLNRIEKNKRKLNQALGLQLRALRLMIREGDFQEQELAERLEAVRKLRQQIKERDEELDEFVQQNLSLEQQAKYLIFFQDFYRQLREQLNRARNLRQQKKKPPNL